MASMVTVAFWPICTSGMSVSSTSTSASITDMSATVSSTVPALFIVPTTTFSPSSMLRRVTMPSNGDIEARLRQVVAAADQAGLLLADLLLAGAGSPGSGR